MKTTFLHRTYAEANPDLAELYGVDDADRLREHFESYGASERRGVTLKDFLHIDKVVMSDEGHIYLSGWADRRVVDSFAVTLDVGYVRYETGPLELAWYQRPDVDRAIGATGKPTGFFLIQKMPDFYMHSDVLLTVNGKKFFETNTMRWLPVDAFLRETLNASSLMANWPAGIALTMAQSLGAGMRKVWESSLAQMEFYDLYHSDANSWRQVTIEEEVEEEVEEDAGTETQAQADGAAGMGGQTRTITRTRQEMQLSRAQAPVSRSIIITLYRRANMLLPQLELLAPALDGTGCEVIVVLNGYEADPGLLIDQLRAFCQFRDIQISVYLCSGNSGFSAGNNFGASKARGEVLIFMNPDIFPPEGDEAQAFAFLQGDPGEGLDGALLYYGDGMLMHAGMYTTADLAVDTQTGTSGPVLRVEHYGKGLAAHVDDDATALEDALRDVPDEGLLVTAALWRIRKDVFEKMGGLSTEYVIAYYEDADFCLRMLEAGRPVRLDRTARWLHLEGAGTGGAPALRSAMWLNRALYTQRFAASPHLAPAETDLTRL